MRRIARLILVRWHRWQLSCIESEREAYQQSMPDKLGPNYLANCAHQERVLRSRIAMLEVQQ